MDLEITLNRKPLRESCRLHKTPHSNVLMDCMLSNSLGRHLQCLACTISGGKGRKQNISCFCSWLYRKRPSVCHEPFGEYTGNEKLSMESSIVTPNQLRWDPFPLPNPNSLVDFVDGLALVCGAGSPDERNGLAIYIYSANQSMTAKRRAFYNSDGDLLLGTNHIMQSFSLI